MILADGAWPVFVPGRFGGDGEGCACRCHGKRFASLPFDVDVKVPVRLQLGEVKTYVVPCAGDMLAVNAKLVSTQVVRREGMLPLLEELN